MQEEQERGAALPGSHARDERQESLEAAQFGVIGDQAVAASATDDDDGVEDDFRRDELDEVLRSNRLLLLPATAWP